MIMNEGCDNNKHYRDDYSTPTSYALTCQPNTCRPGRIAKSRTLHNVRPASSSGSCRTSLVCIRRPGTGQIHHAICGVQRRSWWAARAGQGRPFDVDPGPVAARDGSYTYSTRALWPGSMSRGPWGRSGVHTSALSAYADKVR